MIDPYGKEMHDLHQTHHSGKGGHECLDFDGLYICVDCEEAEYCHCEFACDYCHAATRPVRLRGTSDGKQVCDHCLDEWDETPQEGWPEVFE